jgi:hypothetical protein
MNPDRAETSPHADPTERLEWTTPRLERLNFDGTESAKNPSSFEGSTSYPSGPLS